MKSKICVLTESVRIYPMALSRIGTGAGEIQPLGQPEITLKRGTRFTLEANESDSEESSAPWGFTEIAGTGILFEVDPDEYRVTGETLGGFQVEGGQVSVFINPGLGEEENKRRFAAISEAAEAEGLPAIPVRNVDVFRLAA